MTKSLLHRSLLLVLAVFLVLEFYPFSPAIGFVPLYLVATLCLGYLLIYPETRVIGDWNFKPVMFLLLWLTFNLASYLWARDQKLVLQYALLILHYLVLFLIFSKLFTSFPRLRNFHWFLFGMVLLYLATAVWEMLSLHHLPVSKYYARLHYLPTGPFFGENHLAAYLLLFSPFLLFVPKLRQHKGWGYLSAVMVLVLVVVIVVQGARIAMLALAAFLAWFFIFQVRWQSKLALVLVLALLLAGVYLQYKKEIQLAYQVLQFQTETLGSERSSIYLSSIQIRERLIKESFAMAARTAFIGVGGGNFEPQMRAETLSRTGGITNPHNFLMELFGNWGILILAGFLYLYLHWLLGLWRLFRGSQGPQRLRYLMYLVSLLLFLPTSTLPSTIRWNYFVWIYFAAVNATLHTKPDNPALEEPA